MTPATGAELVAVDVGNSRVKLGRYASLDAAAGALPQPTSMLDVVPSLEANSATASPWNALDAWLADRRASEFRWLIGSVQRAVATQLVDWLQSRGVTQVTLLAARDLPLEVTLPRPDMVGIDRLLGAVAANRLRAADRPAIVIDLGTAITVDSVTAAGQFTGGAILPGIGLSARALHEFTDLLPLLDMQNLAAPPPALGTNTIEAMRAGIYWGAIGGVRHLIELLSAQGKATPEVFLTGGAAPGVAKLIAPSARFEPTLVLGGIALAARHLAAND
ncbi:MAG: type III pantothenate kinase [Planctomycetes bacterium]|nr:type III pantothenate kinase [Planctomycetota bacterium]